MTNATSNIPDANDVLMGGGGAKSASWNGPGSHVGGRIISTPRAYHVTEYDPSGNRNGRPKYFPSGDPIYGLRVDVQTEQRDPMDAEDDGVRRMYLEKKRQLDAVRDAVRAAGADGLIVGGVLFVTETGNEQGKGTEPAKTWAASYRPPSTPVPNGVPNGTASTPTHTTYAQPNAHAQQTASAPAINQPINQPAQPWEAQPSAAQSVAQPVQQTQPVSPATTSAPSHAPVITETVAAAMRNAGIDTAQFTVVPG